MKPSPTPADREPAVRRSHHATRRGFTLIELLVTVSIIAVIASLLLPAITTARQMANRTACASQMRQVFIGLTGYLGDNHDLYPGVAISTRFSDWWHASGQGRWHQNLEPYTGTFAVFNCPVVRRIDPGFAATNTRGVPLSGLPRGVAPKGNVCAMAYNSQDWGRYPVAAGQSWAPLNPGPMNESRIATRAGIPGHINRVPVFFDGVWQNDGSNMQNNSWRAYWPHRGHANMVFYDGHLEVKPRSKVVQWGSTSVSLIVY